MDGSAFIMINKNGFYVLDGKVCLLSLCVVVALGEFKSAPFYVAFIVEWMNNVTCCMNEHGSCQTSTALKQVITVKATCVDTKTSKNFPISVSFYCFLNEPDTSVDSCEYFRFAHRFARLVSVADDADDFLLALPEHDQRLSGVACELSVEFTAEIMKNSKPEQVEAPMPRPQMIRCE